MSISENIILIGMPGAGKSTIGVLLAKALGMDFIDADIVIQHRSGRLLQEIIDEDGIEAFMAVEEDALLSLDMKNAVIATGGSAVYYDKAMEYLKSTGRSVYIKLPYEEVAGRIKNITTRGIVLRVGNSLEDAYRERVPLYEKYADITIDCSGKDIESSLAELMSKL